MNTSAPEPDCAGKPPPGCWPMLGDPLKYCADSASIGPVAVNDTLNAGTGLIPSASLAMMVCRVQD